MGYIIKFFSKIKQFYLHNILQLNIYYKVTNTHVKPEGILFCLLLFCFFKNNKGISIKILP